MKATNQRLIIFTRYPEPGKTKTRLIPALGEKGAAELQKRMTEHTLKKARDFLKHSPIQIEVWYGGGSDRLFTEWLGEDVRYRPQRGEDIGMRMAQAFSSSFVEGSEKVVIIGTDCPEISENLLDRAFQALDEKEIVIGPASDGGYYLIGLNQMIKAIFHGISWGTEKVLQQTINMIHSSGYHAILLETLNDVDRPEDLKVWRKKRNP